jgi:Flp pilus assembly pilin Flp
MKKTVLHLLRDMRGATAIEYGLIIALVGLTVAFAGQSLVVALTDVINYVVNAA